MTCLEDSGKFFGDMLGKSTNPVAIIRVEQDEHGEPCDWTFLYCNDAWARYGGFERADLEGMRFFDVFPDGNRKWLVPFVNAAFEGKSSDFDEYSKEIDRYSRYIVTPTHVPGCCLVSLRSSQREVLGGLRLADEGAGERDSHKTEELMLNALCEDYTAADYVDLTADEMRPIKLNPFAHRALFSSKYPEKATSYSAWTEYVRSVTLYDEDREAYMSILSREALIENLPTHSRVMYRQAVSPNGRGKRYFEVQAVRLSAPGDAHVRAVLGYRPVDDQVAQETQRQRELTEALDAAKQASRAKTTFLFNMSHDIRTPLNAIVGFAELLERHLDDKELSLGYLAKIKTSSDYLQDLLNDVLEMARMESGKIEVEETLVDTHEFNDSMFYVLTNQMAAKGITYTRRVNIEHSHIYCDAVKVKRTLLNVLSNAYKYTLPGGSVSFEVDELPAQEPGMALFRATVTDTGIGMSKEFLNDIFDSFTRERSTTESGQGGAGLGMAISKQLVELMGGSIDVKSEEGCGTKVTIDFVHRLASEADVQDAQDKALEDLSGKRFLLAEDNDLNAEITQTILEEAGAFVTRVVDGVECVGALEREPVGAYDAVLMDIQMPKMDGYHATRVIRSFDNKQLACIPIIATTANAFAEDRQRAIESGMNAHVPKPIKVSELAQALSQVL